MLCNYSVHEVVWPLCIVAGKLVFRNNAAKDLFLCHGCCAKVPVFEALFEYLRA